MDRLTLLLTIVVIVEVIVLLLLALRRVPSVSIQALGGTCTLTPSNTSCTLSACAGSTWNLSIQGVPSSTYTITVVNTQTAGGGSTSSTLSVTTDSTGAGSTSGSVAGFSTAISISGPGIPSGGYLGTIQAYNPNVTYSYGSSSTFCPGGTLSLPSSGGTVTVSIGGGAPNSTYTVTLNGSTVASITTDSSGNGSTNVSIPANTTASTVNYTINTTGPCLGGCSATLSVSPAPTPTPSTSPQVQIIGPSSVTVGTPIQWQATGFTPNSTLTVTVLNLGTNQVIPIGSYTAASDGSGGGSFITTFQMEGVDNLQVTDSTGRYAFAQFQVI